MRDNDRFDVILVGSGAGAGALALELTTAGLRVLVLEKGPRHGRECYRRGANGLSPRDFFPSLEADPHTVVTQKTTTAIRTLLGWGAVCVGGGTVHMGGYFYRFHPDDFRLLQRFGPCEEVADWPYSYAELEPYLSRAEWEIGVSGQASLTAFEGSRSRPLPLPPLRSHPIAAALRQTCLARGLSPSSTPRAINSRPYQGRPACVYCSTCAGWGCPVGARGTSQEALLERAEATGRCEVRPQAHVFEVTVDRRAWASGCVYFDAQGRQVEARAKVVCVCCSAIESARLLLLSRSGKFPDGLANGNGLVGRHLQFHAVSMCHGKLPDAAASEEPFVGVSVLDHYFLPEGVSSLAKGGVLRFGRIPEAESLTLSCEVFHDFLPNARTFVELDPAVRDCRGLPVARIHLDRPEHHVRAGQWLLDRACELLDDLGAVDLTATDVGGTSSYLVQGTCRAGTDRAASVLNRYCQAHEVPNLFVVDGSFMPTSGGAPPTLTLLANSFRTADHIVERWRAGDFD